MAPANTHTPANSSNLSGSKLLLSVIVVFVLGACYATFDVQPLRRPTSTSQPERSLPTFPPQVPLTRVPRLQAQPDPTAVVKELVEPAPVTGNASGLKLLIPRTLIRPPGKLSTSPLFIPWSGVVGAEQTGGSGGPLQQQAGVAPLAGSAEGSSEKGGGAVADPPARSPSSKQKATIKADFIFYAQITFQIAFYCDMLASAIFNGIPIHVGQWGRGRVSFRRFNMRLHWAVEFLESVEDESALVMSIDAADAFFQIPAEEIKQRARSLMKRLNASVILSTENDCFIPKLQNGGCGHPAFLKSKIGRFKYLNSGLWVGTVKALKAMFHRAIQLVPTFSKKNSHQNDQSVLGYMYAVEGWGKDGRMALDYDNELFQSFCTLEKPEMAGESVPLPPKLRLVVGDAAEQSTEAGAAGELLSEAAPSKSSSTAVPVSFVYNKLYQSISPVVHFNGPGKAFYLKWRRYFWWSTHLPPLNATIVVNGKRSPYTMLCPMKPISTDRFQTGWPADEGFTPIPLT